MTDPEQDRRARGIAMFARQFDLPESEVEAFMADMLGPVMAEEAQRANAKVWTDDVLSMRDRSLVVIASLVTQGGVEPRLRGHLQWAIRNGVTRAELDELMVLMSVYVGYPKSSTGMQLLREELGKGDGDGDGAADA